MAEAREDGFREELDDGRWRVWKAIGKGGFWVIDYADDHPRVELREKNRVPMHCPICKRVMKTRRDDTTSYYRWGCCHLCVIEHIEGFEERWKSGWRPDEERVEHWKSKRNDRFY